MHQIRFPLGLRPRPHWGILQRSPRPLAVFKGPISNGRKGQREWREEERKGRERKGKERKREREGEGRGGEQEGKGMGDEKGREGKGREEEGKGFAGSMSNCFLCACSVATYLRCG